MACCVQVLPQDRYPNGKQFFEQTRRMFAFDHPCTHCVAVHNNWIVGTPAKVYRLKEMLQWHVDTNGYYSSPSTRYLEYDTSSHVDLSLNSEELLLKTAFRIAAATHRVLILPEFGCHDCAVTGTGGTKEACSGACTDQRARARAQACSVHEGAPSSAFE